MRPDYSWISFLQTRGHVASGFRKGLTSRLEMRVTSPGFAGPSHDPPAVSPPSVTRSQSRDDSVSRNIVGSVIGPAVAPPSVSHVPSLLHKEISG